MFKYILLTILTLGTLRTFGCTCADVKDKELIRTSDFAFIGVVISNIYKDEWTEEFIGVQYGLKPDAKVRVLKVFKGEIVAEEVIVISSGSSCEINFVPGKRYLITGKTKRNKIPPPVSETLPPVEFDSTFLQDTVKLEQPVVKDYDDWITELQEGNLVIFTSVCQTRYKR